MNRQSYTNGEKLAVLFLVLGSVVLVGGGLNEKPEAQLVGIFLQITGVVQIMVCRSRRVQRWFHHRNP